MLNFLSKTILLTISLFALNTQADTATINSAVLDCSDNSLTKLDAYLGSSWSGDFASNQRSNLAPNKCAQADIQPWIEGIKSSCASYFDVISLTPITAGYSEIVYFEASYSPVEYDGRSAGYGYSYTDRLVLLYRCL